jgi:hypothetical protein
MNPLLFVRGLFLQSAAALLPLVLLFNLGMPAANAALKNWANAFGGSWFEDGNWSPLGVPGSSDVVNITMDGTYTVLVPTGSVLSASITLGGGNGTQTLLYGTSSGPLFITNSAVLANGVLLVTNGGLQGNLLVQTGGQLQLDSRSGLFFYNFAVTNQGTVSWTNGIVSVGGSNLETTTLANQGLFQIFGDSSLSYGGGRPPILLNSGTVRKLSGAGTTYIGMDLINLPSGLVDVVSGTLQFSAVNTNILGGSFTATAPGQMKFYGIQTDAGGTASGSGLIQFLGGTFYLRTNPISQLKLGIGGDVYVDGSTFQQAGAITNLTLDGAQLRGTNRVTGTLTVNSGSLADSLTVLPGGQLQLASTSGSLLYSFVLVNQGTVLWSGGLLNVGGTLISNGGTWTITGDSILSYGGGSTPYFTNYGIFEKTGGTGVTSLSGVSFINQDSGIIRAASGTLQMPDNYTNAAGTMQLDGGTLTASGGLGMTGGQLDGMGTIGANCVFAAGTVSPGQGPGLIQFKSGLTLGPAVTLSIDGTGTTPGTQYDQLSVAGPVALSNSTLQVTSLPTVPVGTSFAIISSQSATPVSGIFNGLPENSTITVGSQLFRIHYSGNTVVLVSASAGGPQFSSATYTNGVFQLSGTGKASTAYTIQATTNFTDWINVGTATADPSGNFSFSDPNAANFTYRFYRTSN